MTFNLFSKSIQLYNLDDACHMGKRGRHVESEGDGMLHIPTSFIEINFQIHKYTILKTMTHVTRQNVTPC